MCGDVVINDSKNVIVICLLFCYFCEVNKNPSSLELVLFSGQSVQTKSGYK